MSVPMQGFWGHFVHVSTYTQGFSVCFGPKTPFLVHLDPKKHQETYVKDNIGRFSSVLGPKEPKSRSYRCWKGEGKKQKKVGHLWDIFVTFDFLPSGSF